MLRAPGAASKALLLVWPYEGVGSSGWDAECLDCYQGDTVCYVGDWQGCTRSHRPTGLAPCNKARPQGPTKAPPRPHQEATQSLS